LSVAERASGGLTGPRVLPRVRLGLLGTILLIGGICSLPLLLYLPFYTEPFMRDEGLYAAFAQIMQHGGIPYQDAFDDKPPLIFGWFYLSFVIFGEHLWAPRLLAALLLSGTTLLMYVEGRLLFSHRYGMLAAAAFALSFSLATLETSANTEFFMLPPLVAALVTFTLGLKSGRWEWYALSGLLSGVAIATKEVSLFSWVLFIGIAAAPHLKSLGWRAYSAPGFRRSVGGLIGGCFVAFIAVIAPFAATGSLPDLFDGTVIFTLHYLGVVPLTTKLQAMARLPLYLTFVLGPWLILPVLGLLQIKSHGANGWGTLLAGWLLAGCIGILAVGRFFDHYFITLLPPLALLVPLGLTYIGKRWRSLGKKQYLPLAATLVLLMPVVVAVQIAQNATIFAKPTADERHNAKYPHDNRAPWESDGPEMGAWLAARTEPDEPIWNFGFQSEIYFYADRRSPTRFIMDRPFWYSESYVDQALVELNENKPVYVIDSAIYEKWSNGKLYTTRIKDWIVANYDYVGKVYYADIWRLKAVDS